MAKLYADAQGRLIRFLQTDGEEDQYPDPPPGTVHSISFDLKTNAGIATLINSDWDHCRLVSNVFTYNGVAQVINSASLQFTDRTALKAILVKLFADQAVSAAEFRLLLRYLFRQQRLGD